MAFSTCSFRYQVSMPVVEPSCASHLLSFLKQACLAVVPDILSGSISYTCRCIHMQVEDLLEMIACLRVFKLPNFKARSELALGFWWHISPHVAYKKLMLQGYFLTKDHFHICDVCAWFYGKGWSLSAWVLFPTCKWWDLETRLCSQEAGRMLGHTLSFSHLQYLVTACHTPFQHALLYIQCLHTYIAIPHGIRNSDPGILSITAQSWVWRKTASSCDTLYECGNVRLPSITVAPHLQGYEDATTWVAELGSNHLQTDALVF